MYEVTKAHNKAIEIIDLIISRFSYGSVYRNIIVGQVLLLNDLQLTDMLDAIKDKLENW